MNYVLGQISHVFVAARWLTYYRPYAFTVLFEEYRNKALNTILKVGILLFENHYLSMIQIIKR